MKQGCKDINYTLGLDLGISSIGWAVIEMRVDEQKLKPYRMLDAGVRLFDKPENPKNGDAINKKRREARSVRRNLRRKKYRILLLKELFADLNWYTQENGTSTSDPYEIRARALDQKVTNQELAIALLHIAKRRGFKSNRKEENDKDGGKYKESIAHNLNLMNDKKYRTYGEMFYKDELFAIRKRNRDGDYKSMTTRDGLKAEVELLLDKQVSFGNTSIDNTLKERILDLIFYQKHYASGDFVKKMVGYCQYEDGQLRAPINSYTFELFRVYQNLNNIRLVDIGNSNYIERKLSESEKGFIVELVHQKAKLNYSDIRNALKLDESSRFKDINYTLDGEKSIKEIETKRKFNALDSYHQIRLALKNLDPKKWNSLKQNTYILDQISEVLTYYKSEQDIREQLYKIEKLDEEIINLLIEKISFSKVGHLSLAALRKVLPRIIAGEEYIHVISDLYPNSSTSKDFLKLPPIDQAEVRNPVVLRALSQARKVVNAVVDRYGSPTFVNVEIARDVGKDFQTRRNIEKIQKSNQDRNDSIVEQIKELGISDPSGTDIMKLKLWKEQGDKCILSLKPINPEIVFSNATQIDHAVPYSRSLDDSYYNKILVLTDENQKKRNQTPYEYLGGASNSSRWREYSSYVSDLPISIRKKQKLLSKSIPEDEYEVLKTFINRDLNDTRYISRFFKNYLEANLRFKETDSKRKVYVFNGRFTSTLRKFYGLNKDRDENHRHHAIDAVLIGLSDQSMLQKTASFFKSKERYDSPEKNLKLSEPWPEFYDDLKFRVLTDEVQNVHENSILKEQYSDIETIVPMFISRASEKKVAGAAHAETVYSSKEIKSGYIVKRKSLQDISYSDLDNFYGNDPLLVEALRERLKEFDGDPKKAFEEDFCKPSVTGKPNVVKKIKVKEKASGLVLLNGGKGVAKNDDMVRVDIFEKDRKYYAIPIYVADTVKPELPSKAIKAHKDEEEWDVVDDSYDFKFSLYPNDYVVAKRGEMKWEGYYASTHRGTGSINLRTHDRQEERSVGIKTCDSIEKYYISVLGDKYKVKEEKRVGFQKFSNK